MTEYVVHVAATTMADAAAITIDVAHLVSHSWTVWVGDPMTRILMAVIEPTLPRTMALTRITRRLFIDSSLPINTSFVTLEWPSVPVG